MLLTVSVQLPPPADTCWNLAHPPPFVIELGIVVPSGNVSVTLTVAPATGDIVAGLTACTLARYLPG